MIIGTSGTEDQEILDILTVQIDLERIIDHHRHIMMIGSVLVVGLLMMIEEMRGETTEEMIIILDMMIEGHIQMKEVSRIDLMMNFCQMIAIWIEEDISKIQGEIIHLHPLIHQKESLIHLQ